MRRAVLADPGEDRPIVLLLVRHFLKGVRIHLEKREQMLVEADCVYAYLFRPKQLGASTNNLVLPTASIQAEIYDALPSWTLK